jgi:putative ABC transport system permease protein
MLVIENVKEANKSIKDNLLRTILTATIIAIGITALVGILTAIDAVQNSLSSGLANLGANNVEISDLSRRARREGKLVSKKANISWEEVSQFRDRFEKGENLGIYTTVSWIAQAKAGSKKTNPNTMVTGANNAFLNGKSFTLSAGRSFSPAELRFGSNVCILGSSVVNQLFPAGLNPVGKEVSVLNNRFLIIGTFEEAGGLRGGEDDRIFLIPINNANRFGGQYDLRYNMMLLTDKPSQLNYLEEEARGTMRVVRQDRPGDPDSFEIERSDSLNDTLSETTGSIRLGGALIAFITLVGAAIGLMNIMMVSVTERTREIGVRKALGATPALIRQQFLMEAVVICLLGGLVGVFFGIIIGNAVASFMDSSGFYMPWLWIFVGLAVCGIVGVASGYLPARKASKLDPIESLRYE